MKTILFSGFLILNVLFFACNSKPQKEEVPVDFTGQLSPEEIENARITPEILWKFGRLGEHRLSPDSELVIYSVTRYDYKTNKSITDIFSVPAEGGESKKLTNSDGAYYNPRFTPDGSKIGYISNTSGAAQLWEMNTDGSGKRQVSNIEGGIGGFEYSPAGDKILYLKDVKLEKTPQEVYPDLPLTEVRIIDDLMYRHWNDWSDYSYSHIFVADYPGEEMVNDGIDIMEGEPWDSPLSPYFDQAEISWSPDGGYIAYTCKKMKGKEYALSTNSDIYLYEVYKGDTENITKGMPGYDKYPSFSPDGTKIAWESMETPGYESDKKRIFIMDLNTGEKTNFSNGFDQDAEHLVWSDDENTIYFISGINATYQIYKVDVNTNKISQLTEGRHNYSTFWPGDDFITAQKMSMSMATELFRVDLNSGEEFQLSNINSEIYSHVKMGEVEERWVKTTDNKDMLVWVIYPPDFDPEKKYPALLYCQGGPQSAVSQFFSYRWNFQIMAANDYIVIAPNRRGLPTFGTDWNEQISLDYGGQNMRDYISAVDALKAEDFIDEERIGAVGASYGGYSVFYLAGHHEGRFSAFISHCGIYNFESMYASTEELFFVNHDIGGPYWETPMPESYRFSPHLYVDRWDTPIMIITGEYDFRIPYTESLQAFNAARIRGIPSKLLVFPNETHFVLKPQNSILWQREFFGWLDKYLK